MAAFRLLSYLVLLGYVLTCVWSAHQFADSPAAVVHLVGAVSAVCAAGLAIDYAGRRGELYRADEQEIEEDEAAEYISRYE
ncbi:hypothetical protein [Nocardiopsis synnemataformans]|uniref:hypothetical protein n=1 Tax=Nocardiopsis synnemataformans TaxID=61305 RepID=UPI003EBABBC9